MPYNYCKGWKRPKWMFFFLFQGSVFRHAKFKSDVHFRRQTWLENLNNPEKVFSRIIDNSRYGSRFPRSATSVLHFVPRCLQSALSYRPKLCFGPEKLISSFLFAGGGNNTSELISNWTAEGFIINSILNLPIIWKMLVFQNYRGLSVPADRNRHQIWILKVKILIILLRRFLLTMDAIILIFQAKSMLISVQVK